MDDGVIGEYKQADRLLEIFTPLGPDVFLPERFDGKEMVNDLFEFTVSVRSKNDAVQAADLVGKNVDVSLELGQGKKRYWNALVVSLTEEPRITRGFRVYTIRLRPNIHLLSCRSDCRIWLNKTTMDVVNTLMSEHGLKAAEFHLQYPPKPRAFSIQWNETDLNYMLRRMEQEGMFFFIRHAQGEQTLVIADHPVYWDKGADGGIGRERYSGGSTDRNYITSWRRNFVFTPGKRAGKDWNFLTPTTIPGNDTTSSISLPRNGNYELYEYPTLELTSDDARQAMSLRMKAVEGGHQTIESTSTVRTLAPGAKLTPYDAANPDNKFDTAVVMSVEHNITGPTYETNSDNEPSYSNSFTAAPADRPATPHRATPRPRIDASQLATIAGPAGEEIHTDEFGRVKLWFFWDRRAKRDGSDTPWIRVGQPWAGPNWGVQVIPRVGMEALVTFEGGDPDRPIVTALVPNPVQKVPNTLPAFKTRMVMQSRTYKGTGENILRFEDAPAEQEVYVQAEKYMNTLIKDNETIETKGNRHKRVDLNQSEDIGQNKAIKVGQNHREFIEMTMNLSVGMARQTAIGLADSLTVGAERTELIGGQLTQIAGGAMRVSVGSDQHIQTGSSVYIEAGKNVVIEAPNVLCLNVRGNFIRIDESGITLKTVGNNPINLNCADARPQKGTEVEPLEPLPPLPYDGPAAVRYPRSYEK